MRRFTAILLALTLALSLAACGSPAASTSTGTSAPSSSAPAPSSAPVPSSASASSSAAAQPNDYVAILRDARSDEDNQNLDIVSGAAGQAPTIVDAGEEWTQESMDSMTDMMMQTLGLTTDMLDSYAFSMSMMNVRAYAVGIFKPAEGQSDAVATALQAYVDSQRQAFQNYLPDQYEVAQDARLETAPGGEVVLVMCSDAAQVQDQIESALA